MHCTLHSKGPKGLSKRRRHAFHSKLWKIFAISSLVSGCWVRLCPPKRMVRSVDWSRLRLDRAFASLPSLLIAQLLSRFNVKPAAVGNLDEGLYSLTNWTRTSLAPRVRRSPLLEGRLTTVSKGGGTSIHHRCPWTGQFQHHHTNASSGRQKRYSRRHD